MKILKYLLIFVVLAFLGYVFVYPWLIPLDYLKKENPRLTAMMKYRMKQWEREGKEAARLEDTEAQSEPPSEPPQGENPEPSKLEEGKRF